MDTVAGAARAATDSLVDRIRAGDRAAEEELVGSYRRGILTIAIIRTRDREIAKDLSQEILLAVLQSLRSGALREPDKLAAFIQGTARNLISNYLRTRARRSECEASLANEHAIDPLEELERRERQRKVRQELESFSLLDQQILLLSLGDGHSLAEVAQRLNLSHEAVRARKSRMIRKIAKKFARLSQKPMIEPLNK